MDVVVQENITTNLDLIIKKTNEGFRVISLFINGPHKGKEYGSLKVYKSLGIAKREFTKSLKYYREF